MDSRSIEEFFPSKILDVCTSFQIIFEKLNKLELEDSCDFLNDHISRLKLCLGYFKPLENSKVVLNEGSISINDSVFKVSPIERDLVSKLAQALNIELNLCHVIFKQFSCSDNFKDEWYTYLSQKSIDSSKSLNAAIEPQIATEFTIFYFKERIACIDVIKVIFERRATTTDSTSTNYTSVASKILDSKDGQGFIDTIFSQLENLPRPKAKKSELKLIQFFREVNGLLELILTLLKFAKMSSKSLELYVNWAFSSELFLLFSENNLPLIEKDWLRSESGVLLVFLQILDVDNFFSGYPEDKYPFIFEFPDLIEKFLGLTFAASSSSTILISAVALFIKYVNTWFQKTPPVHEKHKKILKILGDPTITRKMASSIDIDFMPTELPDYLFRKALNLNLWPYFQRILHSDERVCFSTGNLLLRSYFMGLGFLFSNTIFADPLNFFDCLTKFYLQHPELGLLFWNKDVSHTWRREFLTLAQMTYPSQSDIFPKLLHGLMGDSHISASKAIKYFGSLNTLTQSYSNSICNLIDSVIDPESDQTLAESIDDITYFDSSSSAQFEIKKNSRGFLSDGPLKQHKILIWSINYNGWDFMRCQLENLITSSDPFCPENSLLLQSVEGYLSLLLKAVTKSSKAIKKMYSHNISKDCNIPTDIKVVQHLLILCDQCLSIYEPPLKTLELCLSILAKLFPLYASQICNYLPRFFILYEVPSLYSKKYSSSQFNVVNASQGMRNDPKCSAVVLASVIFADAIIGYFINTVIIHHDTFHHKDVLSNFSMIALKLTLYMQSQFLNWSYSSKHLKLQMCLMIFKLLDHFFISLKPTISPKLSTINDLFNSECFSKSESFYFGFVVDLIDDSHNLLHPAVTDSPDIFSLSSKVLMKALSFIEQLLALFSLPISSCIKSLDSIKNICVFSEFDEMPKHLVTDVLALIDPTVPSSIISSASQVLSIFISCSSKTGLFSSKLQFFVKSKLLSQTKKIKYILEADNFDTQVKRDVWIFLSNLALFQPNILSTLLFGDLYNLSILVSNEVSNPLYNSLTYIIENWDKFVKNHPIAMASFAFFLNSLWKQYLHFQPLIERLLTSTKFLDILPRILITPDKTISLSNTDVAIQANLWKLVATQADHIDKLENASIDWASTSFKVLINSLLSAKEVNSFILNGLKLSPQPASIHIIQEQLIRLHLPFHSLDCCTILHQDSICTSLPRKDDAYIYCGVKFSRSIRYLYSNSYYITKHSKILTLLSRANRDIYRYRILNDLFYAQATVFRSIFNTSDKYHSIESKLSGYSIMLEEFNNVQEKLPSPLLINTRGASKLLELFSSIFSYILSFDTCSNFIDSKLLISFLSELLKWQNYFSQSHFSNSFYLNQIYNLKNTWYQCINWGLIAISLSNPSWKEDTLLLETFHSSCNASLKIASEDIQLQYSLDHGLNHMNKNDSILSKIVNMLISLFRINSFPSSDDWKGELANSALPSLLANYLTSESANTPLYHEITQLVLQMVKFPIFKKYFLQAKILLIFSDKNFKPDFSTKTSESEFQPEFIGTMCFATFVEICTELASCSSDLQDELLGQLNAVFMTYTHQMKNIINVLKRISQKVSFSYLRTVSAIVKLLSVLRAKLPSSFLYDQLDCLVSKFSSTLVCLVSYLRSQGELNRRVSEPTSIEVQFLQRFGNKSWEEYLIENLPCYQINEIIYYLLDYYNLEWGSKIIMDNDITSYMGLYDFKLALNCINSVGSNISVGTILECITIYIDSLDWIADIFKDSESSNSFSFSQQIQIKIVLMILMESFIMLLAQLFLFQSGAPSAKTEHDLFYDICHSLVPALCSANISLKFLSEFFSRDDSPVNLEVATLTSGLVKLCHQTQEYLLQHNAF